MKNSITRLLGVSAALLFALTTQLRAQTTAFTYQGSLSNNGSPAVGNHDLRFRIYDALDNGNALGGPLTNSAVAVASGLFTTSLNFGAGVFDGGNRWLEIGVRPAGSANDFTTLTPRQPLTATPYAVRAASVSTAGISGTFGNAVTFNNAANNFTGNGTGLTSLNATALTGGSVPTAVLDNAWKIGGNAGTTAGVHFIGTTDNQPLEVRVAGQSVVHIESTGDSSDSDLVTDGAANIVMGSMGNAWEASVVGVTISGGGATNYNGVPSVNVVRSDYSTVGGGLRNDIQSGASFGTIGGGFGNGISTNSFYSLISGGVGGKIAANARGASIVGGTDNLIGESLWGATIAGGYNNRIGTNSSYSSIGGGRFNHIMSTNTDSATISGGSINQIEAGAAHGFIGGGSANSIGSVTEHATLTGGQYNAIAADSDHAFIGGGYRNRVDTRSLYSVIGGGRTNRILGSSGCGVIGGGYENQITGSETFVLVGGAPVIAGGAYNRIETNSSWSAISGGFGNLILTNSQYATIPGGRENSATNFALAAGFRAKAIHSGAFVWADSNGSNLESASANSVTLRASGGYRLFSNSTTNAGVSLAPGDTAWSVISDRAVKKDFVAVDSRAVLDKLAAVPVQRWHYQWESADATPHLGPVAQDFKAAFYPGRDDKSITTLEFDGVALAAIQGLNQKLEDKLEQKQTEITGLQRQNAELLKRLEAIEARLR